MNAIAPEAAANAVCSDGLRSGFGAETKPGPHGDFDRLSRVSLAGF
jgi:hypothetical protein